MKLLNYQSTEDLKKLSKDDLSELSDDIRAQIIDHIEHFEGNLGSNLAILELTISLLKNFDPNKYRYLYDTGYQAYAYKMLTDHKNFLIDIENSDDYSVFQEIEESKLDHYSGGHTSVSTLWAAGYNHLSKEREVIEIIGDGSLATSIGLGGMLNFISNKNKGLFILNDNKQGIGLNKFNYLNWEQIAKGMGYSYYEVKDGHDFDELQKAWDFYKEAKGSVFVKVNTIKNNKYPKPFSQKQSMHYFTQNYDLPNNLINAVTEASEYLTQELKDPNTYVVLPGMVYTFSNMEKLQKQYPDRIIDTGIAEEVSIIEAAALANAGKKVYMMVFSTFFQRCYDQIVHDIMRNNSNIVVIIVGTNIISFGDSHHGIYDLNMYNGFENVKVFNPSNSNDLIKSLELAKEYKGPAFIRVGNVVEKSENKSNDTKLNWNYAIKNNNKKVVISYGEGFNNFAQYIKDNNLNIDLIEATTLNPIDKNMIQNLIDNKKEIYTYELTFWKNNLASTIRTKFDDLIVKDFAFNKLKIGRGPIAKLLKENAMDLEFVSNVILKNK